MRLLDLDPRWIHPNVFIFLCPCGCRGTKRELWLSCRRNAPMSYVEQNDLFRATVTSPGQVIVGTKADEIWTVSSDDFATMSVTPSLDYSRARHWHGHITEGAIR